MMSIQNELKIIISNNVDLHANSFRTDNLGNVLVLVFCLFLEQAVAEFDVVVSSRHLHVVHVDIRFHVRNAEVCSLLIQRLKSNNQLQTWIYTLDKIDEHKP